MKKTISILVLFSFIHCLAFAQNQRILSIKELFERIIEHNLDIKIIDLEKRIRSANLPTVKSVYDTFLSGSAGYTQDSRLKSSPFYADELKTFALTGKAVKKFTTGTSLEFDAGITNVDNPNGFTDINPYYETNLGLSLSQPLLKNRFGINDKNAIAAEEAEIAAFSMEADRRVEAVLLSVIADYTSLYLALKVVDIRKQGLERARELLEVNKKKQKLGLVENVDILAMEANVVRREVDLDIANNELVQASMTMGLGLDLRPETDLTVLCPDALPFMNGKKTELTAVFDIATLHRTDYLAIKERVRKNEIELVSRKNELLPSLDLLASLKLNGIDESAGQTLSSIGDFNEELFVGLKISTSLERKTAKSKSEKIKLEKEKLILELYLKELEIIVELSQRTRQIQTAASNRIKRAEIARLQTQKLEAEEKRFEQGRSDIRNLIDYQTDVLNAQEALIRSEVEYSLAMANMQLALNQLYEEFRKEANTYA